MLNIFINGLRRKIYCEGSGFKKDSKLIRGDNPNWRGSTTEENNVEGAFQEPVFHHGQVQNKPFIQSTITNPLRQLLEKKFTIPI